MDLTHPWITQATLGPYQDPGRERNFSNALPITGSLIYSENNARTRLNLPGENQASTLHNPDWTSS